MNCLKRIALYLVLLFPLVCSAAAFTEGENYTKLPASIRADKQVTKLLNKDPNKTQVLFFFSYGCPACARFDPYFEKWRHTADADKVAVYQFPVVFEDDWEKFALLYFVTQNLTPKKDLDPEIFAAIHKDGVDLRDDEKIKSFMVQHGYKAEDVENALNSYAVKEQVNFANDISKAYDINQTPCVVINGHTNSYMLTSAQVGNDLNKLVEDINYVINLHK